MLLSSDELPRSSLANTLRIVEKERDALSATYHDGLAPDHDLSLVRVKTEEWKEKPKEILEEEARNAFGKWITWTFCGIMILLAVVGCIAAFIGDVALKGVLSLAQTLGSILTGIFGVVLGHYFAKK